MEGWAGAAAWGAARRLWLRPWRCCQASACCGAWERGSNPHPQLPPLTASTQPPPHLPCTVTGQTVYVDNGLSIMGLAVDSKTLERLE